MLQVQEPEAEASFCGRCVASQGEGHQQTASSAAQAAEHILQACFIPLALNRLLHLRNAAAGWNRRTFPGFLSVPPPSALPLLSGPGNI